MSERSDGFRVAVKESARSATDAARRFVAEQGETVTVRTAEGAEALARRLSTDETTLRVQRAAPQDGAAVDAYLVAVPDRRTHDPSGTPEAGLTFDVMGNQYGALGEALVLAHETNPPLLLHYARSDLDLPPDEELASPLRVAVDPDPDPVPVEGVGGSGGVWVPDCRATATLGGGPVLREYWCEIKTGGGAVERSQRETMARKARTATVLRIRIDVTALPESYTARVSAVDPAGPESGRDCGVSGRNRTLDDFG